MNLVPLRLLHKVAEEAVGVLLVGDDVNALHFFLLLSGDGVGLVPVAHLQVVIIRGVKVID